MTQLTLVIGSKNYSSWSLRPWLVLKQSGIEFSEICILLDTPTTRQEILRYSPAGRVPVLLHDTLTIWDSLAICEYLAELFPEARLWPEDRSARAVARSISSEMHAGFQNLRQHMPMNCRARLPGTGGELGVQEDIDRISAIWRDCRQNFAADGELLFGDFTIADAMFAPVVSRFITYDVKLDSTAAAYAEAIWSLSAVQEWVAAASSES